MSACLTCSVGVGTSVRHVYPHPRGNKHGSFGRVSSTPCLASAELPGLNRTLPMYKDSLGTTCGWTSIRVSSVHFRNLCTCQMAITLWGCKLLSIPSLITLLPSGVTIPSVLPRSDCIWNDDDIRRSSLVSAEKSSHIW